MNKFGNRLYVLYEIEAKKDVLTFFSVCFVLFRYVLALVFELLHRTVRAGQRPLSLAHAPRAAHSTALIDVPSARENILQCVSRRLCV